MTRPEAMVTLRALALGLAADMAGLSKFMERISTNTEAELLRDLLVEECARALLDSVQK